MAKYRITNDAKLEIIELLKVDPAIPYWMLAKVMGVHENTLAKQMRMPNEQQAAEIKSAIAEIRANEE